MENNKIDISLIAIEDEMSESMAKAHSILMTLSKIYEKSALAELDENVLSNMLWTAEDLTRNCNNLWHKYRRIHR